MKKIYFLIGFLFTAIILSQAVLPITMDRYMETMDGNVYSDDNDLIYMTSGVQNTSAKSVKYAFINGVESKGTLSRPDTLLYGEQLRYEITAVNPSGSNTNVTVRDTIPEGLVVYLNSISNNGRFNPFTRVITWDLNILPTDSLERLSYSAGKMTGVSNRMVNKATISSNGSVQQTNSTFHKGVLCKVTFSAGEHGYVTNATPQLIDYGLSPYHGAQAIPDLGYTFAGWSYPAYEGLKGDFFEATTGMMDYKWITVWGDVYMTARFEIERYTIYYDLYEGTNGLQRNPENYTVTSENIVLNEPTKAGYVFTGWTGTNGNTPQKKVTIPKGSTGDRVYEANWIEEAEMEGAYSISYNYGEGTASDEPNPAYYKKTASDIILNAPLRPGYAFTGWTITSDVAAGTITGTKIPGGTSGNLTCIAGWTSVRSPIHFIDNSDTMTMNPGSYIVEDLPFKINHQPDKPGFKFVGWTGSNGQIPELQVRVSPETRGKLTYEANWAHRFEKDTIYTCELPVLLAGGRDGLEYEWILPDGSSRYSEDLQAGVSGRYILRINYGSMVVADTIVVLSFFETNLAIKDISQNGNKVGREQVYTIELNPLLENVDFHWSFEGGVPSTYVGDTAKIIYHSTGRKKVKVKIVVEKNQKTCDKELSAEVDVYPVNRCFFVNQHVSGGLQNGSSWSNAYFSFQEALAKATEGDYIWVARGEYIADKNTSFFLDRNEIEIYGGFSATENFLSERDISENFTSLNGAGRSVIINYNVKDVHWDGFTIKEGVGTQGGGVFNDNSSVTIANCIIRNNEAKEGGGIYSVAGSPVLYNVEVSGNQAEKGGAIYNKRTNILSTNVTVSGNQASTGGGLYNDSSNPLIQNTIIYGNQAQTSPTVYNNNSVPRFSYSLIEGSTSNENTWDMLFGKDEGNNLDKNPMFRKDGFDKEGNMQSGDYELFTSSCVINKGNNLHINDIQILSDLNLYSPEEKVYTVLPYDLKGNERIMYDRTDMGAFEYYVSEPEIGIERDVIIPEVVGIATDPVAGEYKVKSQDDFTFTITAKQGYTLDNLIVKVGIPRWDEENGIRIIRNDNGSVKVTIVKVIVPMEIKIRGVDPVANEIVNNQSVWSYKNNLIIKSEKETWLTIYTLTGQLYRSQRIAAGEYVVNLEPGNYVVVIDGKSYKIKIDG